MKLQTPSPADFDLPNAPGEKRIAGGQMIRKHGKRILISSIAALGLTGLSMPEASAVITYTIVASPSELDWNTASSWTPFPADAGGFPGAAEFGDTALVTGAFGGVSQTVNLSASLLNPLIFMTLGDTTGTGVTIVKSTNASTSLFLAGATITSGGTAGATNEISAPISLEGDLTFDGATNPLLISGKISPTAAVSRKIANASAQTITFGDIDISSGSNTGITLSFVNSGAASSRVNLNGVIANGGDGAVNLSLGATGVNGTSYQINGPNTYTGVTNLIAGGTSAVKFEINGDQPFGTVGNLNVATVSNAASTFEALNADRTISNPTVVMQRSTTFMGQHSLIFAGAFSSGSGHAITNDITGAGRLVINGRYNTSNSGDDGRSVNIAGSGTTVFNGLMADTRVAPPIEPEGPVPMLGYINVTASGKVIVGGTSTIGGDFRLASTGTVQLGDGGTTGVITPASGYRSVVTGGTTGTGFLAVNRSDAVTLSSTINGGIGLKQIGAGSLTVDTPQFNSGSNEVGDGINPSTLVVTAGVLPETIQTGDFGAPQFFKIGYNRAYQVVTNLQDTSSLKVGQPIAVGSPNGGIYIHSIDSATQVTLFGSGISSVSTGLIPGQNTTGPVVGQALTFGAGSGLGTSTATTTVNNKGTLAGTGRIAGSVSALAGGRLAPGVNTAGNFGVAGTLTIGGLNLESGARLDFDLAATTALGLSDLLSTNNGALSLSLLGPIEFSFNGLAGSLTTGTPYHLINYGTGTVVGDTSGLTTAFVGGLAGYTAAYSFGTFEGNNYLEVTFIPEPTSASLLALASVGLLARRRRTR